MSKSIPNSSSFPPCGAGRDLEYSLQTPEYNGPFINITNLDRTDFDHSRSRGLADMGVKIPTNFSWKDSGGNMIEPNGKNGVRNQMACGSCWAFTTASVLGDRYALKHKVAAPYPSVTYLLSCVTVPGMATDKPTCCIGGNIQVAANWLAVKGNGTKLEACWPYSFLRRPPVVSCPGSSASTYMSTPCLHTASLDTCCASCCGPDNDNAKPLFTVSAAANTIFPIAVPKDGSADMKFGSNASVGDLNVDATIRAIQMDIMSNGPIATSMKEPASFNDWWNTRKNATDLFVDNVGGAGGHAVSLTGWGETNGVRWWEMRNSWGDNGKGRDWAFCRFKMTTDDMDPSTWCGIDIPIPQDGSTPWGGCVSFQAGDKVDGMEIVPGKGGPIGSVYQKPENSEVNWKLMGIVAVVVLVTLILCVIVVNHNRR
jgi:hypothetical protein